MEDAPSENDHELVVRIQGGDVSAYDKLMLRHQEKIAAQMRRFSPSSEVVEDLTQTVFIRAYQGLANYRPAAPFAHWLRTIANRVGYEYWRNEAKRVTCVPIQDMDSQPAAKCEAEETAERFHELTRVMERLRPTERQTLMLHYVDGLSLNEIAETMGWNLAMTKMRAYRARLKLRKILFAGGRFPAFGKEKEHG